MTKGKDAYIGTQFTQCLPIPICRAPIKIGAWRYGLGPNLERSMQGVPYKL